MLDQSIISRKMLTMISILSCCFLTFKAISYTIDTSTKTVLCNTGKGISIYVRVKNSIDIVLFPSGNKVLLTCISRYLPFYDRTIEVVYSEDTIAAKKVKSFLEQYYDISSWRYLLLTDNAKRNTTKTKTESYVRYNSVLTIDSIQLFFEKTKKNKTIVFKEADTLKVFAYKLGENILDNELMKTKKREVILIEKNMIVPKKALKLITPQIIYINTNTPKKYVQQVVNIAQKVITIELFRREYVLVQ